MDEACPFEFNFDPKSFKPGDSVSYRIPARFGDFPFVGQIKAVFDDYVELLPNDPDHPELVLRATRDSRPLVAEYPNL